jgi:hypothetical protein
MRRSHRHASVLAPASTAPPVSRASTKSIVAMTQLVEFRHWEFPMRGMILFVAGLAMIFLASAVQTFGTNWLGQVCPSPGPCFHPEWLAFGIALAAAAYIAWKADGRRR